MTTHALTTTRGTMRLTAMVLTFMALMAAQLPAEAQGLADDNDTEMPCIVGYLDYDSVLTRAPGYRQAQEQMAQLRASYEQELKRAEDEFNAKYEAFLEGQKDFPRTILLKRQNELQELLQKNVAFKQQAAQELQQAETEAMAPLHSLLRQALQAVGRRHRFVAIINTAANAAPFIDPGVAEDVSAETIMEMAAMAGE